MVSAVSALRSRLASPAVAALAIGFAIGAVLAAGQSTRTYAQSSSTAHALDLAAGLSLLGAGALAWFGLAARRLGGVAMLAGAVWFAPDWEGWAQGGPLAQSVGTAVAPLFAVLLLDLVTAAPRGRPRSPRATAEILGAYGLVTALVAGRAILRDPFLDPACSRNCLENVFLVHADPAAARTLEDAELIVVMALGLLVAALGAGRLWSAATPALRRRWPFYASAVVAGAGEAAHALALLGTRLEDERDQSFASIFYVRSASVLAVALALAWMLARARRVRAAVARLAADLGDAPAPGGLRDALATALGDPGVQVAYWLPASRRYVGADGEAMDELAISPGRVRTSIVRAGETVAVVLHDSAVLDSGTLEGQIGSAARLVVENERLQAEVLAQLDRLRASRARIVEAGDAERRRLERDLHDGAQQRLLALSYDLRVASAVAVRDGDDGVGDLLAGTVEEAQAALADLRELAHGIYPAVLAESGLAPAAATLADQAPIAVELGELPRGRYGLAVETAAYVAIADQVADAAARDASFASLSIVEDGSSLVIEIADDGEARTSLPLHVADRIGALGGSVAMRSTTLRAEIPCA